MGAPPTPPGAPPGAPPAMAPGVTEALEEQLTGSRAIHFLTKRVPPPAFLYVTADDGLYVSVSNLQAGLQMTVTATLLLPDGRVQPNAWTVTPPATGAATAYLFPLYESFVLNVSLMPSTPLRYGAAWCFVAVRRGGLASGINLQTLIADYLDAYSGPTWPGAQIRHTAEAPGLTLTTYTASVTAGQGFTFTVPSYARILLRSITYIITTSAAVAYRNLNLTLTDPSGNAAYYEYAEPNLPASQTAIFSYALARGGAQSAFATGSMSRSLPELYLLPGAQVKIIVGSMQAGDQLTSVTLYYEQWFTT